MSGGRFMAGLLGSLGVAAGALTLAPRPAFAKQSPVIVVRVGGDLAARAGQYIDVPVTVDLTGAPGRTLGAYRLRLVYDQSVLGYNNIASPGDFADPVVNTDSSYGFGVLKFTALRPGGAAGIVTLFVARFYVYSDTGASDIALDVQELTEAGTFADLLPLAQVVNGTFCRSLGTWGDVDGDGSSNSRDALIALSKVVGLRIDTIVVDTIDTGEGIVYDTTFVRPGLADVDADGAVTSRDALIILSNAVGLPVPGFRIGLPAAGGCATGSATTLVVLPDSLELQSGQRVPVLVQARDAAGRVVPATNVTWRSDNSAIAAWVDDYYDAGIEAREAGVATLTAELGPGVRGTLRVVVLARRRNWYVDIGRALNAPTQVGSQALPFAFIGDAMYESTDGDTVRVAAGTYEERVSSYVSVTLLGDSLNRPVVDQRGASYYYPTYATINAGSPASTMEIAHFVVRGGGIYIEGHDNTVRDVTIEMLGGTGTALEVYSYAYVPGAPRGGFGAAAGEQDLGRVLVENVVIDGYESYGIEIDQADTAIIRNNQVLRDSVGSYASCEGPAGIAVYDVNHSEVRNNVISNAECRGIYVRHDAGRAVISGNRVAGVAKEGINVSAPVVALDHNVVRNIGTGSLYSEVALGIHVTSSYTVDSVTSLGDSVVGSDHRGFRVDEVGVATIDSLVVDSTGRDSSFGGYGVDLGEGRYTLTHSHIGNTARDNAVNQCNYYRASLRSIGNRITNAGYNGISVYPCGENSGPDTLVSIRDTLLNTYAYAIRANAVRFTQVDTALVDSTTVYDGVRVLDGGRAVVRDSRFLRAQRSGVRASSMAFVDVSRNTITRDSGSAVYLESVTDTATVYGNTIDSSGYTGIWLYGSVVALVDSNRVTNSGTNGLLFEAGASGRATRNRFANNGWWGVQIGGGLFTAPNSTVSQNTISGNALGGAANFYNSLGVVMDATSNFWGDALGPRCDSLVTLVVCDLTSAGDSVTTAGVVFQPFLSAAPPTPAPPLVAAGVAAYPVRAAAATTLAPREGGGARSATPGGTEGAAGAGAGAGTAGAFRGQMARAGRTVPELRQPRDRRPFPPAWQKGREPVAPPPRSPRPSSR